VPIPGWLKIPQKAISPKGLLARELTGQKSELLHREQGGAAAHQG
jgi:hypothetical protein